ncbi:hypothetical protein SBV1_630015 [Verrucomicrobia bacterium]|nr:hypothetical protein SBV1_630015 [Verrucomicrobiota bacterium]
MNPKSDFTDTPWSNFSPFLVALALTSTSQLYFDVSALGQPARLWRIVPVP